MKITTYRVVVNETGEVKEFDGETPRYDAAVWINQVEKTLAIWGSVPTFTLVKITTITEAISTAQLNFNKENDRP